MKSKPVLVGAVLLLAGAISFASPPEAPLAVSPGSGSAPVLIESRCPTFSWGAAVGARAFELAVYRLGEEQSSAVPVLGQRLPGSASSWTPALARCLESGGRYAWSVRAIGEHAESEWSDLRLFEVATGPTPAELEQALSTLERYLALEWEERRPPGWAVEDPLAGVTTSGLSSPSARSAVRSRVPTSPDVVGFRSDVSDVAAGDVSGRFGVVGVAGESGSQDQELSIGVSGISTAEFGVGVSAEGLIGLEGFSRDAVAAWLLGIESAQGLWVDSEVCCDGRLLKNYAATIWNQANGLNQDPDVLALGIDQFSPGANSNFIGFFDLASADGSVELIGEIEADGLGGVHFTGSAARLLGPEADFAEYLPRLDPAEELHAGDVVGVHAGAVSRQTAGAEQIFVVSSKPLVLGRRPRADELDGFVAVALLGQVPVRVSGSVEAGDYLVASGRNDGRAIGVTSSELDREHVATLLGRALVGSLDEQGSAQALVGVFDSKLVGDLVRNESAGPSGM